MWYNIIKEKEREVIKMALSSKTEQLASRAVEVLRVTWGKDVKQIAKQLGMTGVTMHLYNALSYLEKIAEVAEMDSEGKWWLKRGVR